MICIFKWIFLIITWAQATYTMYVQSPTLIQQLNLDLINFVVDNCDKILHCDLLLYIAMEALILTLTKFKSVL